MNSYRGIFQRFYLDYFSEHLWMALNIALCVVVKGIYVKSVKEVLRRWNYIFLSVEFQNKNIEHKPATHCEKQHYSKKNLCWSWPRKERNILQIAAVP